MKRTRFLIAMFTVFAAISFATIQAAEEVNVKDADVPQYLQDIAVTIRTNDSEGSGVVKITKDKQIWIWTCAHVVRGLRIERETPDKKAVVEFNDAKIVKVITEDGRKVGELNYDAEVVRYSDSTYGEDLALLRLRTKKFIPAASTKFYLDKKIPPLGTKLLHCGSLLGTMGSNSVTNGIVSQHGRLLMNGVVFDQTNCASFPGSSGGIVCLEKDGRYIGMLVRGSGESFSLYVPVRRMQTWAKKVGVEFAMDDSIAIPTDDELKKVAIDDSMPSKIAPLKPADKKDFPTKERILEKTFNLEELFKTKPRE